MIQLDAVADQLQGNINEQINNCCISMNNRLNGLEPLEGRILAEHSLITALQQTVQTLTDRVKVLEDNQHPPPHPPHPNHP